MLIVSLKKHFPARLPEWVNSGILVTWGLYIATHPGLFSDPATAQTLSGMAVMTWGLNFPPAALWGLTALVIGMVRACALFVNGAYSRTPIIRLLMSFLSAFVWTQVVIGLMRSGVPNPALIVYAWLVVADVVSAYRAGMDIAYAESQRHDDVLELGRAESSRLA